MSAIKDGVVLSCKYKGCARIWNVLLDDKEKKPGSWTKIVWLIVCMYVGGCACKGSRLLPGILLEYWQSWGKWTFIRLRSGWYEFDKRKLHTLQFPLSPGHPVYRPGGVHKILPDSNPGPEAPGLRSLCLGSSNRKSSPCLALAETRYAQNLCALCVFWCILCIVPPMSIAFPCALCEPHACPVFTMYQVLSMSWMCPPLWPVIYLHCLFYRLQPSRRFYHY